MSTKGEATPKAVATAIRRECADIVRAEIPKIRPRQRSGSILKSRSVSEAERGASTKRVQFHRSALLWCAAEDGDTREMDRLLRASLSSEDETDCRADTANVYNVAMDFNMHNHEHVTLLHLSCFLGAVDSTRMLLALGANPNIADKEGWTALHVAAARGHSDLVPMLLRAGAAAPLHSRPGAVGLTTVTKDTRIVQLILRSCRSESAEL